MRLSHVQVCSVPVELASDIHELELHDVASQSASLVAEYVVDLAQLFNDAGGGDLGLAVSVLGVDPHVVDDEVGLHYLGDLQGDDERDGQQRAHEEEVTEERDHSVHCEVVVERQVHILIFLFLVPEGANDSNDSAEYDLHTDIVYNQSIHAALHFACLETRFLTV